MEPFNSDLPVGNYNDSTNLLQKNYPQSQGNGANLRDRGSKDLDQDKLIKIQENGIGHWRTKSVRNLRIKFGEVKENIHLSSINHF